MNSFFTSNVWPGIVAWVLLYTADYYLTIAGASLYRNRAKDIIVFEGSYELTPFYQKDVNQLNKVSFRFILILVWVALLLGMLWWLGAQDEPSLPVYAFLLGWVLLTELAVAQRHLRNLTLFITGFGSNGLRGRIEYPRQVTLRLSGYEFFGFGGLYLFVFALTSSWFVLGGAGGCLMIGARHLISGRSTKSQKTPPV